MTFSGFFRVSLIAFLCTTQVFAGLPPTTLKGQSQSTAKTTFNFQAPFNQTTQVSGPTSLIETGNWNVLADPGFEASTSGWTASGGATATANSTALGTGSKGYDWDSNSASQTLRSTAFTVPAGLAGKNGVLSCNIKVPSGTATHTMGTWDGSTYVSLGTITSSSSFTRTTFNFIFGAAATTVAIELLSVASNEPEIYVDDCVIADASMINLGSYSGVGDFKNDITWATNGLGTLGAQSIWYRRIGDSLEVYGYLTTGTTTASTAYITMPSQFPINTAKLGALAASPVGIYWNIQTGATKSWGSDNKVGVLFYDGSTNNQVFFAVASASNVFTKINGSSLITSNDLVGFRFTVPLTGSSYEPVYRSELISGTWSGTQVGVGGGWSTTSTTYADLSVATTSNTLTQITATNISCVAESTKLAAITCTLPRTGKYEISATPSVKNATTSSIGARLVDGSGTIIDGGQIASGATTGGAIPFKLGGQYNVNSIASAITFKIQALTGSGANATSINQSSDSPITWTVKYIEQSFPFPNYIGAVTSNSTGQERIERAQITDGSPCTVTSQSGTWISSCTRNSTGDYTLGVTSGLFASAPSCTCSGGPGNSNIACAFGGTITTTSIPNINTRNVASSGANANANFMINCNGPR